MDEDGRWVTINGQHIFIKDGENPMTAYIKHLGKLKNKDNREKIEKIKKYSKGYVKPTMAEDARATSASLARVFNTRNPEEFQDDELTRKLVQQRYSEAKKQSGEDIVKNKYLREKSSNSNTIDRYGNDKEILSKFKDANVEENFYDEILNKTGKEDPWEEFGRMIEKEMREKKKKGRRE